MKASATHADCGNKTSVNCSDWCKRGSCSYYTPL